MSGGQLFRSTLVSGIEQLVTNAIARHHDAHLGASTPVLDAVVIANMVSKNILMGLGAQGFNLSVDRECVPHLDLAFTRFARVCLQTDIVARTPGHKQFRSGRRRPFADELAAAFARSLRNREPEPGTLNRNPEHEP
jgi:hypothetical protein